ncbi:exo-alpha-sialidase [Streptomyces alboflavus]|uniref:exo-alpha-sialidase n=1 Tax=Streptomyces alboflavus TaxID=67267 RepID=UPI00133147AA|nr:exo-alpha-sialidase [Streptomyces alboflavus]
MSDSTAPGDIVEVGAGSGMTLRTYVVDREGTITSDSGTRRVDTTGGMLPPLRDSYPPCSCPRCSGKRARA